MSNVLVLNASYEALGTVSWKRGLCLVLDGSADAVEASGRTIRSCGGIDFEVPAVVRLKEMVKSIFQRRQPLTKGALRARDNNKCQVSGCARRGDSVDHIKPRSKGGKHTWENTCLMCKRCNSAKDDKSLAEMGWKLKKEPVVPDFQLLLTSRNDPLWANWL